MAKYWLTTVIWPAGPHNNWSPFSKCPKRQPRAYHRSLQSLRSTSFAGFQIGMIASLIAISHVIPGFTMFAFIALQLIALVFAAAWFVATPRAFRRFVRKLRDQDFLLCMNCSYPLRGLPIEHKCPECGSAYDAVELCAAWKYWIEKRKLPEAFVAKQASPTAPPSSTGD